MTNTNPFDSLYVTETIDPENFVDVFSPLLVHDTLALFKPGNVVLIGTQGSGKSMLLALLKPETRLAYQRAGQTFPVPPESPFIGAGINLTRSGAIDFGQRPIEGSESPGAWEAFFADFMNYWITRDLVRSLCVLSQFNADDGRSNIEQGRFDEFAVNLASGDSWLGALEGVRSFNDLKTALDTRIRHYRNFLNFNAPTLPPSILETKTSAGEPVSNAAECLRECGVVPESTEIFVRIDQYEELGRLRELSAESLGDFESVVHKMLGLRDPRVSYRIGTRRHAWPDRPRMQGTSAVLEELRNYKLVDLDDLLRRREHRSGQFPKFAEDVFRRRLKWAGYECPAQRATKCTTVVFGPSLDAHVEAATYMGVTYDPSVKDERYPTGASLENVVEALRTADPLSARLGEAWIRQKEQSILTTDSGLLPWDSREREWWHKERKDLALLQIAAQQRQRLIFAGAKEIVELAGCNILAFISVCQSVWDSWLRSVPAGHIVRVGDPPSMYVQDEGIHQASAYWYRKIRSDRDGDSRQRFVTHLGNMFRSWLREDVNMSNPGHNGFSVAIDDLARDPFVKGFLEEAASFGVLVDRSHTSRNRGGGRRVKWYLNAVYAPYFQIPISHVKEPRYVRVEEVRAWLREADVAPEKTPGGRSRESDPAQTRLF